MFDFTVKLFKPRMNNPTDYYIILMFIIKIVFLITASLHFVFERFKDPKLSDLTNKLNNIANITEMMFITGMSFFLMVYFRPSGKNFVVTKEMALLLFAYGFVMVVVLFRRMRSTHKLFSSLDAPCPCGGSSGSSTGSKITNSTTLPH